MQEKLLRYILYLLPPLAYLAICTILLTLPGSAFPQENWFGKIALDKWIHVGMFSLMTVTIVWSVFKMKHNGITLTQIIVIASLCLAYGIAMEFVQKYWVVNRSFDILDIVADGTGAVLGGIISGKMFKKDRPL